MVGYDTDWNVRLFALGGLGSTRETTTYPNGNINDILKDTKDIQVLIGEGIVTGGSISIDDDK